MKRTPERRDPKRFEPPPWEREQFDQLEQKRERESEEDSVFAEAPTSPEDAAVRAEAAVEKSGAPVESSSPTESPGTEVTGQADAGKSEVVSPDGLTEQQMLLLLKAEEPPASRAVVTAATIVSAIVVVFGAVLMIWGIVAYVATRGAADPRGTWGSATMIFFGMLFMGLGVYQGYKTMQKRGVL